MVCLAVTNSSQRVLELLSAIRLASLVATRDLCKCRVNRFKDAQGRHVGAKGSFFYFTQKSVCDVAVVYRVATFLQAVAISSPQVSLQSHLLYTQTTTHQWRTWT